MGAAPLKTIVVGCVEGDAVYLTVCLGGWSALPLTRLLLWWAPLDNSRVLWLWHYRVILGELLMLGVLLHGQV